MVETFKMKNPFEKDNLFGTTSAESQTVTNIHIDLFDEFPNHPFKMYEGKRFEDMVSSINSNGIMLPVLAREIDSRYQILSGHNRIKAAKELGLTTIPTILKENLSEDEALLVVTETNLCQRSFADLSFSERAISLKTHLEAISKQGKRNDLVNEINSYLKADEINENSTCGQIAHKSKSRDKTAERYGLDSRSVSRYIRISSLDNGLKEKLDNEEIQFISAVYLSYISLEMQQEVNDLLDEIDYKMSVKKSELIKKAFEEQKLTDNLLRKILSGEKDKVPNNKFVRKPLTLKPKVLEEFFAPHIPEKDVTEFIVKALREYIKNNIEETEVTNQDGDKATNDF